MADWTFGLFDCFSDIRTLAFSYFLAPCQLAQDKAALDGRQECGVMDVLPMLFCSLCCAIMIRTQVREKYNIEGTPVMDILWSLVCAICSIVQVTRELIHQGAPANLFMSK